MKDESTMDDKHNKGESRADELTVAKAIAGLRVGNGSTPSTPSQAVHDLEHPRKRQALHMEQFRHALQAPLPGADSELPATSPLFHEWKEPPYKKQALPGLQEDNVNQRIPNAHSFALESLANDPTIIFPVTLRDIDVLSGRGGSVNSHVGNRRYWEILSTFREEYQSISSRDFDRKQYIADQVYKLVRQGGTRFMKRDRKNGLVVEQSAEESLEKIKQGLRSAYTPTFLSEDKSSPDPAKTHDVVKVQTGIDRNTRNAAHATPGEKPPDPDQSNRNVDPTEPPRTKQTVPKDQPENIHQSPINGDDFESTPRDAMASQREKESGSDHSMGNDSDFDTEGKIELRDEDVLVGQGSGPNNHPGTVKFLAEVRNRQQEFQALNLKERKKRKSIALDISNWVTKRNGRFLRLDSDGEYQELTINEALNKIKDALRHQKYRVSQEDVEKEKMEFLSNNGKPHPSQSTTHHSGVSTPASTDMGATEAADNGKSHPSQRTPHHPGVSTPASTDTGATEAADNGKSRPSQSTPHHSWVSTLASTDKGATEAAKALETQEAPPENNEQVTKRNTTVGDGGYSALAATQVGTAAMVEASGVPKGPSPFAQHNPTGKAATSTDRTTPPIHGAAETQLHAVSEHTVMSRSFDDNDNESFGDVPEGPEELPEIARNVAGEVVNAWTPAKGRQSVNTSDGLPTSGNLAQHRFFVTDEPGGSSSLLSKKLQPQGHKSRLQQQLVSFHEDDMPEIHHRLEDIPQDLPGQPGREWRTSSAILKPISRQAVHDSTFARGSRNVGPTSTFFDITDDDRRWNLTQNGQSSWPQQLNASFREDDDWTRFGEISKDREIAPSSARHTTNSATVVDPNLLKHPGYPPANERMTSIQVAPADTFIPTRQSTGESQQLELRETDVLSGQGSGAANRPGNQKYLQKVRELQHLYWSLEERDVVGKTTLAKEVYEFVRQRGGRFVYKRFPLDLYVEEISEDKALKKIRRALRDGKPTAGGKG